jgi:hypothetical protein
MVSFPAAFFAAKKDVWSIDWNSHEFSLFCKLLIKRKVETRLKSYELQIKIAKTNPVMMKPPVFHAII